MKTLGLIIIFALMAWTWSAFYSSNYGVTEQTMVGIQNGLQDQIIKVMEGQANDVNNIVFRKFWTKELSEAKVEAKFSISFDEITADSMNKIVRNGSVVLTKADETNNEQVWIVDSIRIEGETIEFQEGLKFTSSKSEN